MSLARSAEILATPPGIVSLVLTPLGVTLGVVALAFDLDKSGHFYFLVAAGFVVLGAVLFCGAAVNVGITGVGTVSIQPSTTRQGNSLRDAQQIMDATAPKTLKPEEVKEREAYVAGRDIPGANAPRLSLSDLATTSEILIRPSAYPTTPMYMLNRDYRILDWNIAFSLAFDRSMEGRVGQSVLEWTYFLDNYMAVFDHGEKVFGQSDKPPIIDVERIEYTSNRYGKIFATKRAYQIPDDNGECLAWLITLELHFAESAQQKKYQEELIHVLGLDQLWSEYAISYDRVLLNTRVYRELLDLVVGVGRREPPQELEPGATVLDLGAGTGNVTELLIRSNPRRTVYAVEQNRVMLDILRTKCAQHIVSNSQGPGVVVIKQDIISLNGFDDEFADCVILNNVLYSVEDVHSCLAEAYRVLKKNGEIRISGPRRDTQLDVLFQRIRHDLEESGKFAELQADYGRVLDINALRLKPMLFQWSVEDVERLLHESGFSQITYSSTEVYADQAMLVCANKPA